MFHLPTLLQRIGIAFERAGTGEEEWFSNFAPLVAADDASLIFVNQPGAGTAELLASLPARVAVVEREWGRLNRDVLAGIPAAIYLVENPRLAVTLLLREIVPDEDAAAPGVHPTALVDPGAEIHTSVSIGPFCVIGKCTIGEGSRIGAWTVVKDCVRIGRNVVIREHCMIGGVGFGLVRHPDGKLTRMPHIGNTVIEDDVEIFPYVNVDRGTLGETRVGRGTKLDHYVHVGHNVRVGEDCIVTARAVFCGSSVLGGQSWLGVGSILKDGVCVGRGVTVGLGSVVLKDVEDDSVVAGVPARVLRRAG